MSHVLHCRSYADCLFTNGLHVPAYGLHVTKAVLHGPAYGLQGPAFKTLRPKLQKPSPEGKDV
eukprot:1185331-Amphidinium_carterae.1